MVALLLISPMGQPGITNPVKQILIFILKYLMQQVMK